jgi:predicted secreted protein
MTIGSPATIGYGTLLMRKGVAVAEVKDISGPNLTRTAIDVTHQQSPGRWTQMIKGLKTPGEVTFDINYLPSDASHNAATGILSDFAVDNVIDPWSIVFPDGTVWTFPAFVSEFTPNAPVNDVFTASVTLTIAGQPTLA